MGIVDRTVQKPMPKGYYKSTPVTQFTPYLLSFLSRPRNIKIVSEGELSSQGTKLSMI